jgi:hypothetical protein
MPDQPRWKRLEHTALPIYAQMLRNRLGALETRIAGLELDAEQALPGQPPNETGGLDHLRDVYNKWNAELAEVDAAIKKAS